jgi:hypothetical protein
MTAVEVRPFRIVSLLVPIPIDFGTPGA